ncbi:hypothetical protein [Glutamicibacter sp. NPDC087344]|uniref:hypothetical protein n=1 Tax=Glutamicibacter sp. NPDC087344 TaxID=3363994 RepID=UPI00382AF6E8
MKSKSLIAVILSLAAILFIVAFAMDWMGRSEQPSQAGEPVPSATEQTTQSSALPSGQEPVATPSETTAPKASATGQDTEASAEGDSSEKVQATRPSWNPQPTQADERLEVPEEPSKSSSALPSAEPREPVLSKTPKTGAAEGELTKGFPKDAIPLPASTTVERSSVEAQSSLVMVGVQGRSKQSVEDVLAFYESHFKDLQWLATTSDQADGTTQLQAGFGKETATVTLHQLPTGLTEINAAGVFTVEG